MRLSTVIAVLAPIAAVSAQQNFTVIVGGSGALTFNPTTVNASVGDTIAFQFQSKNHTVTQSTFASPCQIMTTPAAGIDSGFMPVAAGATSFPEWSFTMTNDSVPLWFYCRQTGHCKLGMVFAINPTESKTFAAFQAAAEGGSSTATSSGSASGTTSSTSASAKATNGAMRYGSSAATVLAAVGLAAGILL
jgi:plastocyanin